MNPTVESPTLWPLAVYFFSVLALVGAIIGLSYVLGERHREPETAEPFESGIEPTGSARLRINAQFYLIAMFFVIFDMETVFIIAWAVGIRELGWGGYLAALVFILVLVVALVYEWRSGALDWGPLPARARRRMRAARVESRSAPAEEGKGGVGSAAAD